MQCGKVELPFVGTIALHLMLAYFLVDRGLKSDILPEVSIKVHLINAASLEKSSAEKSSVKVESKRERALEKAIDVEVAKPKKTDAISQKFEKGDKNSAIIEPRYNVETLNNIPPAYPASARRLGHEGTVILQVLVLASGEAGNIDISRSSGCEQLDKAALEAVRKWHFIPAKKGLNAVNYLIQVPITFKLAQSQ